MDVSESFVLFYLVWVLLISI